MWVAVIQDGTPLTYVLSTSPFVGPLAERIAAILEHSSAAHGISWLAVVGDGRSRSIMPARKAVARELRALDVGDGRRMSLCEVGTILGGRDHTTVLYLAGERQHGYVPVAMRPRVVA